LTKGKKAFTYPCEDTFHRGGYYARIAEIYSALGNENEALRFRGFSEKELQKG